jgi:putative transcriptional regulator
MSPQWVPRPGDLLVAAPHLGVPFARTVIWLLEHDDDGTLGVVLNQPTEVRGDDVLAEWSPLLTPDSRVYNGGPVSLDSALGLAAGEPARLRTIVDPVQIPGRGSGALGLVDLDADPDVVARDLAAMRLVAGYSGWSPGQLAGELREGAWAVAEMVDPVHEVFVASAAGEEYWAQVLRRQPGTLAWWADAPDDPTLN